MGGGERKRRFPLDPAHASGRANPGGQLSLRKLAASRALGGLGEVIVLTPVAKAPPPSLLHPAGCGPGAGQGRAVGSLRPLNLRGVRAAAFWFTAGQREPREGLSRRETDARRRGKEK